MRSSFSRPRRRGAGTRDRIHPGSRTRRCLETWRGGLSGLLIRAAEQQVEHGPASGTHRAERRCGAGRGEDPRIAAPSPGFVNGPGNGFGPAVGPCSGSVLRSDLHQSGDVHGPRSGQPLIRAEGEDEGLGVTLDRDARLAIHHRDAVGMLGGLEVRASDDGMLGMEGESTLPLPGAGYAPPMRSPEGGAFFRPRHPAHLREPSGAGGRGSAHDQGARRLESPPATRTCRRSTGARRSSGS